MRAAGCRKRVGLFGRRRPLGRARLRSRVEGSAETMRDGRSRRLMVCCCGSERELRRACRGWRLGGLRSGRASGRERTACRTRRGRTRLRAIRARPLARGHARRAPLAFSHAWETDREDRSQLRARILGGCSAHNACVISRARRPTTTSGATGGAMTRSSRPAPSRAPDAGPPAHDGGVVTGHRGVRRDVRAMPRSCIPSMPSAPSAGTLRSRISIRRAHTTT